MAGYSGTPLAKKLGIRAGQRLAIVNGPAGYRELLGELPADLVWLERLAGTLDLIQIFAGSHRALDAAFAPAIGHLAMAGALWVSWPKRSSGVVTDLDENIIRTIGLALGVVDVKVCAVDEVWSGLEFVRCLEDRPGWIARSVPAED